MPSIPWATHLMKPFEALMLSGVTPGYLITYLLYEGMESQKSDYSQISIEGPTDAIALRQDGNFLRPRLNFFFDFVVIDNACLHIRVSFTGSLEKIFR
jgi:hypothetical protein